MKRYITYILATMSLAWMVSCSTDDGLTNPSEAGRVALQFHSSTMTRSAGVESYNENLIASIDCYFYPTGSTGDAVWHYHAEPNAQNSYTIQNILMPAGQMNAVFGTGTTGTMYVIANYTGGDLPNADNLDNSSIAELKQKVISTQWPLGNNWAAPASFVMDGEATVNKSGSDITGSVSLVRSAAKIELTITNIQDEVTNSEGKKYVPAIGDNGGSIGLTMHNAATSSWIDNAWSGTALAYNADAAAHTSLTGYGFAATTTTDGKTNYKQTTPFYSYPTHWGPSGEAYLLLVVPWQEVDDEGKNVGTPQSCYYEIPIGKLKDNVLSEHIARNNHYQISINVGTLGSFVLQEPLTLEPSYMVVDWTSGNIEAQIKDQRYLVVDKHSYVMENITSLTIPYVSSHECEIVSYSCTQEFLYESNNNPKNNPTFDKTADGSTNRKYSVNIEGSNIVVKHGLNNDLYDSTGADEGNGVFDFTPYTITFTIQHKDDSNFKQTVTITQNPAMYGTAYVNSDYTNGGGNNEDNGFVWVNGYQGAYKSSYSQSNFDDAEGSTDNSLTAVSMYVITVTSLDGTNYVVGDPRTTEYNNLDEYNFTWAEGNVLGTNTKRKGPLYYLPTDADLNDGVNSHTYNMVAPKFRVSSVYGAIDTNGARRYYENMKGRCASYQEDGYPAGRWRLPTAAEFEIINTLTNKGLLPTLYATTMDYWCAHGYGRYNSTDNKVNITTGDDDYGSKGVSVRCVYDDWYWGSERVLTTEAEKNQFTWGDKQR